MTITSFSVRGYKSIRETGDIPLAPGMNIIVGRNNAGKTALLETIGLRLVGGSVHRTPHTHKNAGAADLGESTAELHFDLPPDAVRALLRRAPSIVSVATFSQKTADASADEMTRCANCGLAVRTANTRHGNGVSSMKYMIDGWPDTGNFFNVSVNQQSTSPSFVPARNAGGPGKPQFLSWLGETLKNSVYFFKAERLNIALCGFGTRDALEPNASNLPEVLHVLQTGNPWRFRRLVEQVRAVFPDIRDISVTPVANNLLAITIWDVDPESERKDLTRRLSDCGTGLGQVLAILYVAIHSDDPQTILIDEPQSFLHPGAARKLMEILRGYEQHQFVVATHLPSIISAAQPDLILRLEKRDHETQIQRIEKPQVSDLQGLLSELGVRLSDVFGMDRILWVEGATEEVCLPIILSPIERQRSETIAILSVVNTGDFHRKHKKDTRRIIEIYRRLSGGQALLPPAIAFLFDREDLSDDEQRELQKQSNGNIRFLPRRMFENYLVHAPSIAALLTDLGKRPVLEDEVVPIIEEWSREQGKAGAERVPGTRLDLLDIDGAALLKEVFDKVAQLPYDKVRHGLALTQRIMQDAPKHFLELQNMLNDLVSRPA
jgi:energy-coupling factor transporter ATP-binding protein EcfA2